MNDREAQDLDDCLVVRARLPIGQDGIDGVPRRSEVATIGDFARVDRDVWLRDRIVRVIEAGIPRMGDFGKLMGGNPVRTGWHHEPGTCPWWELRQRLGGRVNAADFAEAIETLLAAGRIIEVWLAVPDRRTAPHCLILPGRSAGLRRPVARARGLPEILEGEHWYEALRSA